MGISSGEQVLRLTVQAVAKLAERVVWQLLRLDIRVQARGTGVAFALI